MTTAEFWQYDTRLGRRWQIDPVGKPWMSGYTTFDDCPIRFIDPKGNYPYAVGNTNTVQSITPNKDGGYTITEETVIVTKVDETWVETSNGSDHPKGYTTSQVHTVQKIQTITSTTTIDKDGKLVSNSATNQEYMANYYDVVVKNPATDEIIPQETHQDNSDPNKISGKFYIGTSAGTFVGPMAQTAIVHMASGQGGDFPVKTDGEIYNEMEFEGIGGIFSGDDNGAEGYEAGQTIHNLTFENGFGLAVSGGMDQRYFREGTYSIYQESIKNANGNNFVKDEKPTSPAPQQGKKKHYFDYNRPKG